MPLPVLPVLLVLLQERLLKSPQAVPLMELARRELQVMRQQQQVLPVRQGDLEAQILPADIQQVPRMASLAVVAPLALGAAQQ